MNAHTNGSATGIGTIVAQVETGNRELGVGSKDIERLGDLTIDRLKEKTSSIHPITQSPNRSIRGGSPLATRHLPLRSNDGHLPRFVVTLDATPDTLVRIPLAITGKWVRDGQEFAITLEDLKAIVRNFGKRKNGEINVDYDHASEMPEVAAGPCPVRGALWVWTSRRS